MSTQTTLNNALAHLASRASVLKPMTSPASSVMVVKHGHKSVNPGSSRPKRYYVPGILRSPALTAVTIRSMGDFVTPTSVYTVPDGTKFAIRNGIKPTFEAMYNKALSPYVRLSFSVLPGTRDTITAQRAAALSYLEHYIARYDVLMNSTRAWMGKHTYSEFESEVELKSVGGRDDDPGDDWIEFSRFPTPSFYGRLDSMVTRRPDASLERAAISAFYGLLMDSLQNDVLDQLVKLHPSVKWRNKPFASTNALGLLKLFETDFSSEVEWRTTSWLKVNGLEDLVLVEAFPDSNLSAVELRALLVTKCTWFVNILETVDVTYTNRSPAMEAAVNYLKDAFAVALWKKLVDNNLDSRVNEVIPHLTKNLKDFLTLAASRSVSDPYSAQKALTLALTEAAKIGVDYSRGTFIFAVPGQSKKWHPKGAIPLYSILTSDPATLASMSPKDLTKLLQEKLPSVLVALASGGCVVGHPGFLLYQTYASTVKRYGFNVLIDEVSSAKISVGIDKLYRLKPKEARFENLFAQFAKAEKKDYIKYWSNIIHVGNSTEVGGIHDVNDKKDTAILEECIVHFTSSEDFPAKMTFNRSPLINRSDLLGDV